MERTANQSCALYFSSFILVEFCLSFVPSILPQHYQILISIDHTTGGFKVPFLCLATGKEYFLE